MIQLALRCMTGFLVPFTTVSTSASHLRCFHQAAHQAVRHATTATCLLDCHVHLVGAHNREGAAPDCSDRLTQRSLMIYLPQHPTLDHAIYMPQHPKMEFILQRPPTRKQQPPPPHSIELSSTGMGSAAPSIPAASTGGSSRAISQSFSAALACILWGSRCRTARNESAASGHSPSAWHAVPRRSAAFTENLQRRDDSQSCTACS